MRTNGAECASHHHHHQRTSARGFLQKYYANTHAHTHCSHIHFTPHKNDDGAQKLYTHTHTHHVIRLKRTVFIRVLIINTTRCSECWPLYSTHTLAYVCARARVRVSGAQVSQCERNYEQISI